MTKGEKIGGKAPSAPYSSVPTVISLNVWIFVTNFDFLLNKSLALFCTLYISSVYKLIRYWRVQILTWRKYCSAMSFAGQQDFNQ